MVRRVHTFFSGRSRAREQAWDPDVAMLTGALDGICPQFAGHQLRVDIAGMIAPNGSGTPEDVYAASCAWGIGGKKVVIFQYRAHNLVTVDAIRVFKGKGAHVTAYEYEGFDSAVDPQRRREVVDGRIHIIDNRVAQCSITPEQFENPGGRVVLGVGELLEIEVEKVEPC